MSIITTVTILGLVLACGVLAADKRAMTHEDVWLMKRVGEPVVSPDGKQAIFSVTEPDYDPAKTVSDLWIVPTDGSSAVRRLTSTRGGESGAVFSPDGTRIAFSAKREGDEVAQIYVLSLQGGEAERVTSLSTGARGPQWRPDGKAILFESNTYPGAKDDEANKKAASDQKGRKYNARVYDTFPIRFWNAWLDDTSSHVFVQELNAESKVKDILAGTRLAAMPGFGGLFQGSAEQNLQPVWAADGKSIVFAAIANRDQTMSADVESHLYRVDVAGGEPVRLTPTGSTYSDPQFSPDGKILYALASRSPSAGRLYSLSRLVRVDSPSKVVELAGSWDRSVSSFKSSRDGSTLYVEAEDDGFDKFFTIPAQGGTPKEIAKGYNNPNPIAKGLIARYGTAALPPQIVLVDVAGSNHKMLTNFDATRLAEIDTRPSEHFWFTAKNGKKIHNLMTYPPHFDSSKKYPLLIFPHGGPNGMSKDSFSTRWNNQLLVGRGYVLLQTNYTGSTGFGEKFADDVERDVLRGPANEILEAIEVALKKYPFIDSTRQAAAGASYGGYLMNWFNGHTNQFRCLVNHAGAINNESQYGTNDGGMDRELRMGGPVWEKGGQWNDQSPMRYSGSFKTPTLITQGELDFRVPMSESMTTFKILQRRRVPTRLLLFPDEGHWILKGENNRKHMEEVLGWLQKYLEP